MSGSYNCTGLLPWFSVWNLERSLGCDLRDSQGKLPGIVRDSGISPGNVCRGREGSEAVPIAAQLALLSQADLEQGIFLADVIVLMHNHHNLQRGRLHMYSQGGLGQQTNQKNKPSSDCLLIRSRSVKYISCKIFTSSGLPKWQKCSWSSA